MTAERAAEVLAMYFGYRVKFTPNGFAMADNVRLECGGGIAGNGGAWSIVEVKSGKKLGGPFTTTAELRAGIEKWFKDSDDLQF